MSGIQDAKSSQSSKKRVITEEIRPIKPARPLDIIKNSQEALDIAYGLALGTLTHATLISGDELICRDIFLLACSIISDKANIAPEDNPDVLMLSGSELLVSDIEELLEVLAFPPRLSRRMIYIKKAGRMSETVQNKLLKTLEEPPQNNQFVLSGSDGLLSTVLSRCMTIGLPESILSDADSCALILREAVERDIEANDGKNALTLEKALECLELSGNTLDDAYKIALNDELYELHKSAFEWFAIKNQRLLFETPTEFTKSRDDFEYVLGIFIRCLSDMMRIKNGHASIFFSSKRGGVLKKLASELETSELLASFDICVQAIGRLRSNAPARQTMDNLYARCPLLNRI